MAKRPAGNWRPLNASLIEESSVTSGKQFALAIFLAFWVPFSASADRFASATTSVIATGSGGNIIEYAQLVASIRNESIEVRFRGRCDSACTLFLSLPPSRTCITPGTTFAFHRAYGAEEDFNEWGTDYLLHRYPDWVQAWILARGGLTDRLMRMDYSYASQFLTVCGRDRPEETAARS